MGVAKVALSLPASLLARIDRRAKQARVSRSALVREVMERSLRQPHEDEILRKARHLYAEVGEEDRALSEAFLPLAAETLPLQAKRRRR
ncbi:MAG: ribbon-helix-helix protein, CopG family [candidate division NC10 bacterium]|nr:ribbon-helix-helix protein, CopG family [candidate division NC10 bacterium]